MTPPLPRFYQSSPLLQPDAAEALLAAASVGDANAVRRLLVQGANPDATDLHGFSALHLACYFGHAEVVHVLVAHDANVNRPSGDPSALQSLPGNSASRSLGRFLSPLIIASACGHAGLVEFLLECGADVTAVAEGGITPLIAAASMGRLTVVQHLVLAHAPLEDCRFDGATAMVMAASAGHLDVLRLLHASGAQLDPPCSPPIIHRAAHAGHADVVRYLLWNGAAYDGYSSSGMSALCLAASMGHIAAVQAFMDFGVLPNDLPCKNGSTALHCAARARRLEMVSFLISKRARLLQADAHGITPLQSAVQGGHPEIVRCLLAATLATRAAHQLPFAAALANAMRVVTCTAVADQVHETTLLHLACHHGHLPVVQVLLGLKVDVNAVDSLGCSALRVACDEGHTAVAELLIEHGADVDLADYSLVSPLMSASHFGREAIVQLLLNAGCDVHQRDSQQLTALEHATLKGCKAVATYLVAYIAARSGGVLVSAGPRSLTA
eukprot:EG_transcript_5452